MPLRAIRFVPGNAAPGTHPGRVFLNPIEHVPGVPGKKSQRLGCTRERARRRIAIPGEAPRVFMYYSGTPGTLGQPAWRLGLRRPGFVPGFRPTRDRVRPITCGNVHALATSASTTSVAQNSGTCSSSSCIAVLEFSGPSAGFADAFPVRLRCLSLLPR